MLLGRKTNIRPLRPLLTEALGALLGAAALLQAPGASAADEWKFQATLYGWLPDVEADSNLPPITGQTGSTQVDASTILDSLQGVFMGTLEARKGRWGGFTDLIYLDLSDSKTGARPFTVGGRLITVPGDAVMTADYSLKGWVWTLAGEYAAIETPGHNLNLFGGFRYLTLEQKFNWAFSGNVGPIQLPLRQGALSSEDDFWDAIVGVHGQVRLGQGGWYLPYYLDVGTGSSDWTWQALAGVGYEFNWGSLLLAYRYLDYEFPDNKALSNLTIDGGLIGVSFRF